VNCFLENKSIIKFPKKNLSFIKEEKFQQNQIKIKTNKNEGLKSKKRSHGEWAAGYKAFKTKKGFKIENHVSTFFGFLFFTWPFLIIYLLSLQKDFNENDFIKLELSFSQNLKTCIPTNKKDLILELKENYKFIAKTWCGDLGSRFIKTKDIKDISLKLARVIPYYAVYYDFLNKGYWTDVYGPLDWDLANKKCKEMDYVLPNIYQIASLNHKKPHLMDKEGIIKAKELWSETQSKLDSKKVWILDSENKTLKKESKRNIKKFRCYRKK